MLTYEKPLLKQRFEITKEEHFLLKPSSTSGEDEFPLVIVDLGYDLNTYGNVSIKYFANSAAMNHELQILSDLDDTDIVPKLVGVYSSANRRYKTYNSNRSRCVHTLFFHVPLSVPEFTMQHM